VHPDQNVRLAVRVCDERLARGTLRKMFPQGFGDSLEPTARIQLW
jgi:hypothetical protein